MTLRRDWADPAARATHKQNVRASIASAEQNLASLRRARTFDPRLRTMLTTLVEAQSRQLEELRAAERFIDSGDPASLNSAGGMLEALRRARKAERSYQEQTTKYLRDNKLIRDETGS